MGEHDYEQLITVFTDTENVDAFHLSKSQKEAIRHALEQCARMERDNLVLVPIEPTEVMLHEGASVGPDTNEGAFGIDFADIIYRAMLNAAPPTALEGEE